MGMKTGTRDPMRMISMCGISLGGVAVVIASATIEAVGGGAGVTQSAISITLFSWAALVGILGVIFGLTQWKHARVPDEVVGSAAV